MREGEKQPTGFTEVEKVVVTEAIQGALTELSANPSAALAVYPYTGTGHEGERVRDYFKIPKETLTPEQQEARLAEHRLLKLEYAKAMLESPDNAAIALRPLAAHYEKHYANKDADLKKTIKNMPRSWMYMMMIANRYPSAIGEGLARGLPIPDDVIERAGIIHVNTGFPVVDNAAQNALQALRENPLEALKTYPAWEQDGVLRPYFAPDGFFNTALASDPKGKATREKIETKLRDAYVAAMKKTPENATAALIAVANYCEKNGIPLTNESIKVGMLKNNESIKKGIQLDDTSFAVSLMLEIATHQPKAVSDATESKLCDIPPVVVDKAIAKKRESYRSGGHPAVTRVTDAAHEGNIASPPVREL